MSSVKSGSAQIFVGKSFPSFFCNFFSKYILNKTPPGWALAAPVSTLKGFYGVTFWSDTIALL